MSGLTLNSIAKENRDSDIAMICQKCKKPIKNDSSGTEEFISTLSGFYHMTEECIYDPKWD